MSAQIVFRGIPEGNADRFTGRLGYFASAFLIVFAFAVSAFIISDCSENTSAESVTVDGIVYELDMTNNTAAAADRTDDMSDDPTVPAKITGPSGVEYTVTSIQKAF